jgi:hypothetical protein
MNATAQSRFKRPVKQRKHKSQAGSEQWQQLAQEAAKQIRCRMCDYMDEENMTIIIHAAIAKSHEPDAQPQRSVDWLRAAVGPEDDNDCEPSLDERAGAARNIKNEEEAGTDG